MCGIFGFAGRDKHVASKAISLMRYRGRDSEGIHVSRRFTLAHVLHAINSDIPQPLVRRGAFVANCEIYNWRQIADEEGLSAGNDAELFFGLIEKRGFKKALSQVDGPYAVAYDDGEEVHLARDILGVKPLWYVEEPFAFASEKKTLDLLGLKGSKDLDPRKTLSYNHGTRKIALHKRAFFKVEAELENTEEEMIVVLIGLLTSAVAKRIPPRRFGILFSGGIDSTLIAYLCKKLGKEPTLYTAGLNEAGLKEAEDLIYAKKAAKELGLPLNVKTVRLSEAEKHLKDVISIIEDRNVVKVGVALPFHLACKEASKDGCKVLFSGLGSEEIFAGYDRHRNSAGINSECRRGLMMMHERDNYRDDCISMAQTIELRHPFLDHSLIKYSLRIPGKYKVQGDGLKIILRKAALSMGLSREFAMRKKRAAQYGSNFDKAIAKLAHKKGMTKSDYLSSL